MNATKHAIVEGLKAATGAIDNGPALPGSPAPLSGLLWAVLGRCGYPRGWAW